MKKREFVQLLHTYKSQDIAGWYWSEKFNGQCAFWDGGLTTGMSCRSVPFANTAKHHRYKIEPKATGLWSRYGQPIQCPPTWRQHLPPFPLHGELMIPGLTHQGVAKVIKKLDPNPLDWMAVRFKIFDAPDYASFAQIGRVANQIWEKLFTQDVASWIMEKMVEKNICPFRAIPLNFKQTYIALCDAPIWNETVQLVEQHQLPEHMIEAAKIVDKAMWEVVDKGGEGLVLRSPYGYWEPKRSHDALKMKPADESIAEVVSLHFGELTDKGSSLLGKMGALIVRWNGKTFKIGSGFNHDERELSSLRDDQDPIAIASAYPGQEADPSIECAQFPRGSKFKFKYRELTDDGIPAEARHVR